MIRFNKSLLVFVCLLSLSCQHYANKSADTSTQQLPPKLLKPEVKKIWIPEIIKNGGTEWEEGHYLYRIQRETSWSR